MVPQLHLIQKTRQGVLTSDEDSGQHLSSPVTTIAAGSAPWIRRPSRCRAARSVPCRLSSLLSQPP
jgi:hypothetical protein